MTDHEKALRYCYYVKNAEKHRAASLLYYYAHKFERDCASYRYDQAHYQQRLEYFRQYHKAKNDATRKCQYKSRPGARVSQYATCQAHARAMIRDVELMSLFKVKGLMK